MEALEDGHQSKKARIAMLHYSGPPVVGGVETVIVAHAKLFYKNGYDVTLIAGRELKPIPGLHNVVEPLIDSNNIRINIINRALDKGEVPADFAYLENQIFERLYALLKGYTACIVHNVFTLHKNLALTAALLRLAQVLPTKFIAWCHDLAWTNQLYLTVLYERYPWNLLKTSDAKITYIAISPQRQQEILTILKPTLAASKVPVVPNGIDLTDFLSIDPPSQELIRAAGLDKALYQGATLFLLPSRITRRKNIELAIEIIAALKKQNYHVNLIVTGPPGPHNPKNDEYVRELLTLRQRLDVVAEVNFLIESWQDEAGLPKPVTDTHIAALYRFCDAMLMPSSQEGFGIPILEAGLARLPIFCTDLEPFHELALEDATYFAVSTEPTYIATIIMQKLAADPAYRLRRRVLANFTWDSIFYQKIEPLVKEDLH